MKEAIGFREYVLLPGKALRRGGRRRQKDKNNDRRWNEVAQLPWKAPLAAELAAPAAAFCTLRLERIPWENSSCALWKLAPVRRYIE